MNQSKRYITSGVFSHERPQGTHTQLENHEWDALAERLRRQVRAFVDEQIDNEITKLEAKRT